MYQSALTGVKAAHFSGRSSSANIAVTGQTGTHAPPSDNLVTSGDFSNASVHVAMLVTDTAAGPGLLSVAWSDSAAGGAYSFRTLTGEIDLDGQGGNALGHGAHAFEQPLNLRLLFPAQKNLCLRPMAARQQR